MQIRWLERTNDVDENEISSDQKDASHGNISLQEEEGGREGGNGKLRSPETRLAAPSGTDEAHGLALHLAWQLLGTVRYLVRQHLFGDCVRGLNTRKAHSNTCCPRVLPNAASE